MLFNILRLFSIIHSGTKKRGVGGVLGVACVAV